jgi:quercetin dioxygenase-like cupin family protein
MSADVGGDAPRWAHLLGDPDVAAGRAGYDRMAATVAELGSVDLTGRAGVVWSLPHGADLDANLVHLHPGGSIDSHVNDEVDIVISVIAGDGQLVIGGTSHRLCDLVVALVPKGERREIRAGSAGITYLSIHSRRSPLGITRRPTNAI